MFLYPDAASARAGISDLSDRLKRGLVAIVGLGGTGSYILDFVSKTHVPEIHLFDKDDFLTHNAFRAPGAASLDDLRAKQKKVVYFAARYGVMRKGIVAHPYDIDEDNVSELKEMSFVFLALDRAGAKRPIIEALLAWGTSFVDAGMGLQRADRGQIGGQLRVTTCTPERHRHALSGRIPLRDGREAANEYTTNIQIAELNALNAAHAVIRWKKLWNYYLDLRNEHHTSYMLDRNSLSNEEIPGEDE